MTRMITTIASTRSTTATTTITAMIQAKKIPQWKKRSFLGTYVSHRKSSEYSLYPLRVNTLSISPL